MKVFVVTSHLEYGDNLPETWVEGVYETLEKAQKVMEEVFNKQLDLNWNGVEKEDIDKEIFTKKAIAFNHITDDYMKIEIWERELE